MGLKTAGVGHFTIPTAPAAGTSCTSGAANVFTTTYVQLIASTGAALFITGVHLEAAAAKAATYIIVQLATGAAGSETVVGQYLVPLSTGSTVALGYRQIYPPILVANATRIACKTADSVGAAATLVTLECINQSNVVDDGVAVGSVAGSVGSVTGAVGSVTGAVGSVTGAVGSVTGAVGSVTAGVTLAASQHVIVDSGTVTTLSNLPAAPTSWLTAAAIATGALNGKGDWLLASSYTAPPSAAANRAEMDANSTGLAAIFARTDVATSTRLAAASYTAPDNTRPANFASMAISVGGAVTAGTVGDKTGYALSAAYDPAKTASQAGDAMALTVAERASVADGLLARNVSGGSSAGRTVKQALAVLRNKVEVVAGTLTVYDTDDTTVLFTAAVTTAAGNPISAIDPA